MIEKYLAKLQPVLDFGRRYIVLIIIVAVGLVYGFLIYSSGKIAQQQPSQVKVTERYQGAKRPKIDQVIVKRLTELKDNNIQFQALIDGARQNPFSE